MKLTPTQELILEVLAARYRTGEALWTFDSRPAIRTAARQLQDLGLVHMMSGMVERTFRASLTIEGQRHTMSDSFASPLDRAREKAYDEGWQHGLAFASGKDDFMHNPYRTAVS